MKRVAGAVIGITITVLLIATMARAEDKVQTGNALFSSQKCVLCHAAAGKGNKKGSLEDVANRVKADEIREWLTAPEAMREKTKATRTPAMKDPKLTKDQVDALVAFLLTQKGGGAGAEK
jgi:mono/diheme cytochrome c family protein